MTRNYTTAPRHWKLWLLITLSVSSIITGWIGYCDLQHHDRSAFLVAISHLVLNGFDFEETNGWIDISRFLGLAFFVLTAATIIERLFHTLTWLRRKYLELRQHDLIIGLGWRGKALLSDGDKLPVIAIDLAPDPSAIQLCNELLTPIKIIDACEKNSIQGSHLKHTRHAFVCTGSDAINLQVVHHLANSYHEIQNRRKSKEALVCSVGLESTKNFRAFTEAIPKNSQLDLRIFHTESVTARLFLRENELDRFETSPNAIGARVVIVGDSAMAETLTRFVIQQGIFESSKELEIIKLVTDHKIAANEFTSEFPCFQIDPDKTNASETVANALEKTWSREKVLPTVRFFRLPPSEANLKNWINTHLSSEEEWITTVIVAKRDPMVSSATALAAAPALQELLRENTRDVALWFLFNHRENSIRDTEEKNLNNAFPDLKIRAFSDFLGICTRLRATGDDTDNIAKRVHSAYYGADLSDAEVVGNNWKGTSEEDKDSSRQCAEHCFVKERIGKRLGAKSNHEITDELARVEHRRWCAEKLLKGVEPLTRIPSAVAGQFEPNAEEERAIQQWFLVDKPARKAFTTRQKLLLKQIDLIPFDDLAVLFSGKEIELEGKTLALSEHEQNKDRAIIENLDAIIGER